MPAAWKSLPLGKSDRISIRRMRSSEQVTMHNQAFCWAITVGLTLWISTSWLNERWILGLFELGVFGSVLVVLFQAFRSSRVFPMRTYFILALILPTLGSFQLVAGITTYSYVTLLATLDWSSFAGMVCVGMHLFEEEERRIYFFTTLSFLGAVVTALELYQIFILGRYEVLNSGFPLLSSNHYVELAELILPVILYIAWKRVHQPWWLYGLAACMLATAIASGARTGSFLLIAEFALCLWSTWKRRQSSSKRAISPWIGLAILWLSLVLVECSDLLLSRLMEAHPLEHRTDFLTSALRMFQFRPLYGVGLGCFPIVYPQFQLNDSQYAINHVHNDYMEILTEGGVIFVAIWFGFLVVSFRNGIRSFWGLGCVAILFHSLTDFPIYRPTVAALLALLMSGVAETGLCATAPASSKPFRME
jgi:O-antigen ligase